MLRVAHATDIHWFAPPPLSRLAGKRLLGSANLYLARRRFHFDRAVQDALVQQLVDLAPDAVIITGDLTAQALPEEFALAREQLEPVLASTPTLVQNGNHDVYTGGSARDRRLGQWFGPWLHVPEGDTVARMDVGPLTVLGLDPCRPHWSASGRVPAAQLQRLREILDDDALLDRIVLLALHYPVVDRGGALYDGTHHGLRNADALVEVLRASQTRPTAILHGHKHHGYVGRVDLGDAAVPTYDPGASGYAYLPDEARAACMNVYNIDEDGTLAVDRYRYTGSGFEPEAGGAYATGR